MRRSSASTGRTLRRSVAGLLLLAALSSAMRLGSVGAVTELTPTPIPGVLKPEVPWPARPAAEGGFAIGPREGTLPRTGLAEVAVELSDPPAARAYALARTVLRLPDDVAQRLAAQYAQRLDAAQLALLGTLTAPPINATLLGRTQWTLNSILIRVDAAHLDAIRALPGVIAVRPLRIGQLTENAPVPGPLTPAKPLVPAPIMPGRSDGAMVY
ncbi:MAG: hypothetical protein KatS3mg051_1671 [Anaerolineae bacterium]|nr:MAG: hypothetical protein KatS3mg051_1671 [Anaerolineae bacterium]